MSKINTKISKYGSSKATTLKSVLLQIHLQQYLPLFQRNEIDFTTFLTLNEQTLKSVGIGNDSHRKVLLLYIRKLQQLFLTSTAAIPFENNMLSEATVEEELTKASTQEEDNLVILSPITEEEEPSFPEISNDVTVTRTDEDKSQDNAPNQELNEHSTNGSRPNSTSVHVENDYTPTSRSRKHFSTDNEDLLAIRRRGAVRDSNWRLSMPVTNDELPPYYSSQLPSYYDIVDRQRVKTSDDDELPPYSCSVYKSGYVFKKNEFSSKGYRSRDRSWKKQYLYLWGTLLRIYKSEPIDVNRVTPIHEFSMLNVQIGLATDYSKRSNVIRMRISSTGHQFLFEIQNHDECVSWIEKLQSSANISPILDEREMPMFITLPMRRRRVGVASSIASSDSSSLSSSGSVNYDGINIINNNSSAPVSASGLTFQQFNDMARELQQVQITEALPQQQLSW
uniref:PH and SEC7 domain-containing protein 2 n=1 Tax=Anthurium amnicola TaxID=1678845 RepID=A0A1D1Z477_9ARAE